jgi:hypothetical protein
MILMQATKYAQSLSPRVYVTTVIFVLSISQSRSNEKLEAMEINAAATKLEAFISNFSR